MSQIPRYDLTDPETGGRCLSRNRRFNHTWYSSKKLDIYDNKTTAEYATRPSAQNPTYSPTQLLFVPLDGANQTL
jgi:hypothetical protein